MCVIKEFVFRGEKVQFSFRYIKTKFVNYTLLAIIHQFSNALRDQKENI